MSGVGIKAGKAFVVIEALDKTGAILSRISNNFRAWGSKLETMGKGLLMKSLLAMTPTALSLKTYTEFDDAMRRVEARSKGTGLELDHLREKAKFLGRTTSFTSAEVANLMSELAGSGFNRSEIDKMVESVLALSRVSNSGPLDTRMAAELVGSTLRIFNMDAKETARVSDAMAVAMTNARFPFEDLQTALTYGGQAAARFNRPFEEMMATITMLKRTGMDSSSIGAAYRNILLEASSGSGTKKFNEELEALTGLTIKFRDAKGDLRPIPRLLFDIGEAVKGLGTAQQGDLLGGLFGKRAFLPSSSLISGENAFKDMTAAFSDFGGRAQEIMDLMDKGIGGTWRRFTSAIEGVAISLGEILEPALTDASLTAERWLDLTVRWMNAHKQVVVTVVSLTVAMAALGATMVLTGYTLQALAMLLRPIILLSNLIAIAFKLINIQLLIQRGIWAVTLAVMTTYYVTLGTLNALFATARVLIYSMNFALSVLASSYFILEGAMVLLAVSFAIINDLIILSDILFTASFWSVTVFGAAVAILETALLGLAVALAIVNDLIIMSDVLLTTNFLAALLSFLPEILLVVGAFLLLSGIFSVIVASVEYLRTKFVQAVNEMYIATVGIVHLIGREMNAVWQGMVAWLQRVWTTVKTLASTITTGFQGVMAALTIGDTEAAWSTAMDTLMLSFDIVVDEMMNSWNDFANYFIKRWIMATTWFSGAWNEAKNFVIGGLSQISGMAGTVAKAMMAMVPANLVGEDAQRAAEAAKAAMDLAYSIVEKEANDQMATRRGEQEKARNERQKKIDDKRKALQDKVAALEEKAKLHREGTTDNLAKAFSGYFPGSGMDLTDGLETSIGPNSGGFDIKANEAILKGSYEAAQLAYEHAMQETPEDDKELPKKSYEKLEDISESLRNLEANIGLA